MVRDFRAGAREFFAAGKPGPKTAPGKDAARPKILELRAAGHSIDEIAAALAAEGTPLNRTGIAEVIAAEGLPRLWRRPDAERGGPAREIQARAGALNFGELPARAETRLAGLLLAIPDLIALGVPDMVAAAGYPSTPRIPALSYVLSLLALKLTATRRVSHVYDIAADPGAALFAALTALPKATALTTYSYRLEHRRQAAFLAALDKAALTAGLADGEALNLDFHAIMHWGEDPALERHYVPARSQRTRSVLTFFAEDAATHTLLYANADVSKASQNREVIAFADHWHQVTGHDPALLIFDSKLTTQAVLAELDDRHIGFVTLRARHPGVTAALAALPASAWTSMTLARAGGRTRRVKIHDDPATQLSAYPRPIRQLAVTGLGHDQPTLLITNDPATPVFPVTEDADVAVVDGEGVRAWFGPAGWVLAGPWCACWRGGGQSVVISVTAARALCSSTMFLRPAQAATRAWVARLLTARGRPRAASWMSATASSLNRGSERPASLRWWVMYPAVCSGVMAGMAYRMAIRWSRAARTPRRSIRRRVGWPMSRQASGLAASISELVRILTASSW